MQFFHTTNPFQLDQHPPFEVSINRLSIEVNDGVNHLTNVRSWKEWSDCRELSRDIHFENLPVA